MKKELFVLIIITLLLVGAFFFLNSSTGEDFIYNIGSTPINLGVNVADGHTDELLAAVSDPNHPDEGPADCPCGINDVPIEFSGITVGSCIPCPVAPGSISATTFCSETTGQASITIDATWNGPLLCDQVALRLREQPGVFVSNCNGSRTITGLASRATYTPQAWWEFNDYNVYPLADGEVISGDSITTPVCAGSPGGNQNGGEGGDAPNTNQNPEGTNNGEGGDDKGPLPDLQVDSLKIQNYVNGRPKFSIETGDQIRFLSIVKNDAEGEVAIEVPVEVRFVVYPAGQSVALFDSVGVNVSNFLGAHQTLSVAAGRPFDVTAVGEYNVWAMVDPQYKIAELNENNNINFFTIEAVEREALAITLLASPVSELQNPLPYAGDVTLTWVIWGKDPAVSCTGTGFGSWNGPKDPKGGSQTLSSLVSSRYLNLWCRDANGTTATSRVRIVVGPPPTPTVILEADPNPVPPGGSTKLTWTVGEHEATHCFGTNSTLGWNKGTKTGGVGGSEIIGPLNSTTFFGIRCAAVHGPPSNQGVVRVVVDPTLVSQPPVVGITADTVANSVTIPHKSWATISWQSFDAYSCEVEPTGWTGLSQSVPTGILNGPASYTYSLTCVGVGGESSDSVTVNVSAPLGSTADIQANGSDGPLTVPHESDVDLTWDSSETASCSIDSIGRNGTSGQHFINRASGPDTLTYTLNCVGENTTDSSDSVVVNVSAPQCNNGSDDDGDGRIDAADPGCLSGPGGAYDSSDNTERDPSPDIAIAADPVVVNSGGSSLISWTADSVQSCTVSGPSGQIDTFTATPDPPGPANYYWSATHNATNITEETIFTVTCTTTTGAAAEPVKAVVQVRPSFQNSF